MASFSPGWAISPKSWSWPSLLQCQFSLLNTSRLFANLFTQDPFVWWSIQLVRSINETNMTRRLADPQYRTAILAPRACSKFLSYLIGWMSVIAWQTATASAAFLGGTMIQGLLVLNYPFYEFYRWHGTLLYYAIILVSLFVNTYLAKQLPRIETMVLILHVMGFFAILVPLVYLAPHGTAKDVFTTFSNSGGWSSGGLSFFIGLTTSMYAFIGESPTTSSLSVRWLSGAGIDAAAHMG